MLRRRYEHTANTPQDFTDITDSIRSSLTCIIDPLAKLKDIVTDDKCKVYLNTIDHNAKQLTAFADHLASLSAVDTPSRPQSTNTANTFDTVDTISENRHNSSIRILVVNNAPEIFNYMTGELGGKYKFDHSPGSKEALRELLENSYDIVICDMTLPDNSGIILLKQIKNNPNICQIPVIMMLTDIKDKIEVLKYGADSYIVKPFYMDELSIIIDNLQNNMRRLQNKFDNIVKDRMERPDVKDNNDILMDRIMKAVNENMSDPNFNVDSLASSVGVSRAQLHRKMKEITGFSTGKFLRNLRMEQAGRLLRDRKINISQIAYNVGYNDLSHFSIAFKSYFGLSPSKYTEKYRNES